ncbi:LEAF RUST 10 DISEASE-RESISTANCE LOCUS RECEPTOR-LIKE PROTEIN KINASE-like 1.3 isoform X2 [Populus nigra]|uniref:LEAF RUST 10 DISEASE-RESISTANCE LOCUS RECEPTOR-LIKE PROTEIN KINASE-like 1.3 isoform X2 n=1 Tax=Populus nigra TaxID=3691 RepID=UPI002B266AB4|nr:LEAF RUST 10 DISEASE-RESISTANCE LOCUS RECEPTOR-LIKE PROTEIN KINASE-like 1.3 isoform X2 [Populus nigra]
MLLPLARMNSSAFSFLSIFVLVLLLFIQVPSSSSNDGLYTACSKKFECGGISADFPFWGNDSSPACGFPELKLRCENNFTKMNINQVAYRVLEINQYAGILRIAREDSFVGLCSPQFKNSTFNPKVFESDEGYKNLTIIYGCKDAPPTIPSPGIPFTCKINEVNDQGGYIQKGDTGPGECNRSVLVPVSRREWPPIWNLQALEEHLKKGFEVRLKVDRDACWECKMSSGVCGIDYVTNQTTCYCPNQSRGSKTCAREKSRNSALEIGLSSAGAVIGAFVGFWILAFIQRRRRKAALEKTEELPIATPSSKGLATSTNLSQTTPSLTSLKSDIDKGSTYFGVRVFSYDELEEATNFFDSSRELGDGGFGIVYYGVLRDGHEVAVKRLYENNMKRTEQFMNEIEILAHLQHRNLVKLHGCTSRHSRELLLVYEYIPNGTVADHLHGRQSNSGLLTLPVRLSIAIETASALVYLHASDVIHRDVKTNNILLDNDFCVKVADFGLSRLFPTNATHLTTAPQGTPGYVDPEYYQCYQLTDKSDVYSFGVVLIELISALQAVDTNRRRHDINLSNMAVNMIQNHALNELVDPFLGFDKDFVVRRMVTSVAELAFRCLQKQREMRPTMEEVLEILKRIEKENYGAEKADVLDISEDDVGLLKHASSPLQLSADSISDQFWESSSSTKTPHSY